MEFGSFKLKDLDNMIEEDERNLRNSQVGPRIKPRMKMSTLMNTS